MNWFSKEKLEDDDSRSETSVISESEVLENIESTKTVTFEDQTTGYVKKGLYTVARFPVTVGSLILLSTKNSSRFIYKTSVSTASGTISLVKRTSDFVYVSGLVSGVFVTSLTVSLLKYSMSYFQKSLNYLYFNVINRQIINDKKLLERATLLDLNIEQVHELEQREKVTRSIQFASYGLPLLLTMFFFKDDISPFLPKKASVSGLWSFPIPSISIPSLPFQDFSIPRPSLPSTIDLLPDFKTFKMVNLPDFKVNRPDGDLA
jgi:hypothetical protein